ncbi:MAG: YdiU family protein [Gammaproteobacteria bacterium]|nr:YdiU family protein [Gammaproteobacteria bacterium]
MLDKALSPRISALTWRTDFVDALPGDPEADNHRRQVTGACYSPVAPTPVSAPRLVAASPEAAALIGLAPEAFDAPDFVGLLSGNELLPGMQPYAMCYGGHQFGHWAGQLGDGRAINLGEVTAPAGEAWTLQLKGAGPTPYSRTADGRAVLRSSVREFLCSEAMHHLGIPTTRALSLVITGDEVIRDMFYDGNAQPEPGAIVCRMSRSFLRPGNFQLPAARDDKATLEALVRYTLRRLFPEIGESGKAAVLDFFESVCRSTASLMVEWMRVGFVHGVMNTDNLSILGETIDYGPYGWLDNYDPGWTPNTTDAQGRRYCFGNQPQIALWNMVQFANALYPLIEDVDALQERVNVYAGVYQSHWQEMMARKLGLGEFVADDEALVDELLEILQLVETDMTIFYRGLADIDIAAARDSDDFAALTAPLAAAWYQPDALPADYRERLTGWLRVWAARCGQGGQPDAERHAAMQGANPKYVLRNYLAQQAIDAATGGDYGMIAELLEVMRRPYDEQPGRERFAGKRPDWARQRAGCSMLSCSS